MAMINLLGLAIVVFGYSSCVTAQEMKTPHAPINTKYQNFIELWDKSDGRPADTYQLTMNKDPVCETILQGLNIYVPRVRSELFGYIGLHSSDKFLQSPNSVKWQEYKHGTAKYLYTFIDINGDGEKEWIVKEYMNSDSSGWVDRFFWSDENIEELLKQYKFGLREKLWGKVLKYLPGSPKRPVYIQSNILEPTCSDELGCRASIPRAHTLGGIHFVGQKGYYLRAFFPFGKLRTAKHINIKVHSIIDKHAGDYLCAIQSEQKYIQLGF